MSNKSLNCLTHFDFVSPTPTFYVNNSTRLKNIFGGILTLLALLSIGAISLYFIALTFGRSQLSIIYNKSYNNNPLINLTNFPFQLTIYDTQGAPIDFDSGIFSVYVNFWKVEKENHFVPNILTLKTDDCKNSKFDKIFDDLGIIKSDINSLCLDTMSQNLTMHGSMGGKSGEGVSFLNFYINKCVNSTENNFNCKSEEIILDILTGASLTLMYIDYFIDPRNETAGQLNYKTVNFPLSPLFYKIQMFKLNTIHYYTDIGYVFEENNVQEFFQVQNYIETVDITSRQIFPGNFDRITFSNGDELETYKRSYIKLQTLMANVGGVANGIMMIAKLLCFVFYNDMFNLYLANSVFSFLNNKNENLKTNILNDKGFSVSKITNVSQFRIISNLNNNNLEQQNFKKRNSKMIKFSFKDVLIKNLFCKKSENHKIINKVMEKLQNRMNIEYLLLKYNEIDRLKAIIFDDHQLKIFNELPKEVFDNECTSTLTTKTLKLNSLVNNKENNSYNNEFKLSFDILKAKKDDPYNSRLIKLAIK